MRFQSPPLVLIVSLSVFAAVACSNGGADPHTGNAAADGGGIGALSQGGSTLGGSTGAGSGGLSGGGATTGAVSGSAGAMTGGAGVGSGGTSGSNAGAAAVSGAGLGGAAGGSAAMGGAATGGCAQRELFINGNFDTGGGTWTEFTDKWPSLIVTSVPEANITAQSGAQFARVGGYVDEQQEGLMATVEIPPSATNLVFSFYSIVKTEDTSSEHHDALFISMDSDAQYVEEYLYNTDANGDWRRFQKVLDPAAAGKTLVAIIRVENDSTQPTSFYLDSFSLTANVCD